MKYTLSILCLCFLMGFAQQSFAQEVEVQKTEQKVCAEGCTKACCADKKAENAECAKKCSAEKKENCTKEMKENCKKANKGECCKAKDGQCSKENKEDCKKKCKMKMKEKKKEKKKEGASPQANLINTEEVGLNLFF